MSEDTGATAPDTPPEPAQAPENTPSSTEQTVPVSALQKERQKAKAQQEKLEAELAKFKAEAEERAKAEMSELERVKADLAAKAKEAETLAAKEARRMKSDLVTEAARAANFLNPSVAAKLADLDAIEDSDDAAKAVKQIAKAEPYLVEGQRATPSVQAVLKHGKQVSGDIGADEQDIYTQDELKGLSRAEIADNRDKVKRSMEAHAKAYQQRKR